MEYVVGWFLFSIVAGIIAGSRGRSGIGYFALSVVLSPLVGIILAAAMPSLAKPATATTDGTAANPADYVSCPACRELVRWDASKCKHCGTALTPQDRAMRASGPGVSAWAMLSTGFRVVIALLVAAAVAITINVISKLA